MMTGASAPESNPVRATPEQSGAAPGHLPGDWSARSSGVVLIGFMGVGKSRVGKELARLLQTTFVDTDKLIECQHGPIGAIFAQRGEKGFRLIEESTVIASLAAMNEQPCVVSLGGGAVTTSAVRAALAGQPRIAWLTAPLDVVLARVRGGGSERPLAADEQAFARLYSARQELYEACSTARFLNDGTEPVEIVAARLAEWARANDAEKEA